MDFFFLTLLYGGLSTLFLFDNFRGICVPLETILTFFYIRSHLKKSGHTIRRSGRFLLGVIFLLSISTVLTASNLVLWNHLLSLCLWLVFLLDCYGQTAHWGVTDYFREGFFAFGKSLEKLPDLFVDGVAYAKAPKERETKGITYVGIGVLIAVPLVGLVVALLASADAVFSSVLARLLPQDFNVAVVLQILVFFVIVCSVSYATMKQFDQWRPQGIRREWARRDPRIGITILLPLSLVYLAFSAIQVVYLFLRRGSLPTGYSYATYAREGFFQLLFVCLLNVCLVLLFQKIFEKSKALTALLFVVSATTYVMTASSGLRMLLYVRSYGLTRLRVYVLWALCVIGLFLAGLMIQIKKERFPLFRYGLAVLCLCYLVLSFGKPDYWIAKYNLAMGSGADTYYLSTRISLDGATPIAEYLTSVRHRTNESEEWVNIYKNHTGVDGLKEKSLRQWNFSEAQARRAFDAVTAGDGIAFEMGSFTDTEDDDVQYGTIEFEGRMYIGYGTLGTSLWQVNIDQNVGYLVLDENSSLVTDLDDKSNKLYTLADDPEHNYLMERDTATTLMNQPTFWRAIDTQGVDIATPDYIQPLEYAFWE